MTLQHRADDSKHSRHRENEGIGRPSTGPYTSEADRKYSDIGCANQRQEDRFDLLVYNLNVCPDLCVHSA